MISPLTDCCRRRPVIGSAVAGKASEQALRTRRLLVPLKAGPVPLVSRQTGDSPPFFDGLP